MYFIHKYIYMYIHMYIYIMNPSSWSHRPGGSVVKQYLYTVELHDMHMEWMCKRTLCWQSHQTFPKFSLNLTWAKTIKPRPPSSDSMTVSLTLSLNWTCLEIFFCFYSVPGNFNRNVIVHLKTAQTWGIISNQFRWDLCPL